LWEHDGCNHLGDHANMVIAMRGENVRASVERPEHGQLRGAKRWKSILAQQLPMSSKAIMKGTFVHGLVTETPTKCEIKTVLIK